jgi:hypothetical protein
MLKFVRFSLKKLDFPLISAFFHLKKVAWETFKEFYDLLNVDVDGWYNLYYWFTFPLQVHTFKVSLVSHNSINNQTNKMELEELKITIRNN